MVGERSEGARSCAGCRFVLRWSWLRGDGEDGVGRAGWMDGRGDARGLGQDYRVVGV